MSSSWGPRTRSTKHPKLFFFPVAAAETSTGTSTACRRRRSRERAFCRPHGWHALAVGASSWLGLPTTSAAAVFAARRSLSVCAYRYLTPWDRWQPNTSNFQNFKFQNFEMQNCINMPILRNSPTLKCLCLLSIEHLAEA